MRPSTRDFAPAVLCALGVFACRKVLAPDRASDRKKELMKAGQVSVISADIIEKKIYWVRRQKVMLSPDLAELYQVEPRALIQAVKRNIDRFPEDFMFQLTWDELSLLKSHFVISNAPPASDSRSQSVILRRGYNIKYPPYAFTEQGIAMLSSVLRSKRAIQVNIEMAHKARLHYSEMVYHVILRGNACQEIFFCKPGHLYIKFGGQAFTDTIPKGC